MFALVDKPFGVGKVSVGVFSVGVMAQGVDERTGSSLLTGLRAAVADLVDAGPQLLTGREQLAQLAEGLRVEARLHSWLAAQAAKVDAAEVAWQEHGTSTATWLAEAVNLTRREAGRLIAAGQGLRRFPLVGDAAECRGGAARAGGGDHAGAG